MSASKRFRHQASAAVMFVVFVGLFHLIQFLSGANAQKPTSVFTNQFWLAVIKAANAEPTFCANVTKYNVRGLSTIAKMLQEQTWSESNFPVKWQFCALTSLGFATWQLGWEKALRLRQIGNVSMQTYPQPWRNWAYCGSCSVQMYVVQQQQTKQEFLIEFYRFWENKDEMVVSREIAGGFIRVARFR